MRRVGILSRFIVGEDARRNCYRTLFNHLSFVALLFASSKIPEYRMNTEYRMHVGVLEEREENG